MLLQLFGKKHLQHTWQSLTFQSTALPQEMAAWARKAGFYQYVFSSCRKEAQSLEELRPQKNPLEVAQQQAWEALTWIEGSTISLLRPGNVSQFCLQCLPGSTSKSRANLQTRTSEKNKNKKISLTDASLKKKKKKADQGHKGDVSTHLNWSKDWGRTWIQPTKETTASPWPAGCQTPRLTVTVHQRERRPPLFGHCKCCCGHSESLKTCFPTRLLQVDHC